MKTCKKCGETKKADAFYGHPGNKDGKQGKCKECTKADVKRYRAENIDAVRKYDRSRGRLASRVAARAEYAKTVKGIAVSAAAKRAYIDRNKGKHRAHIITGNAIRDGKLKKQPCEWCGADNAQAHHFDYQYPLDVTWFCVKCHSSVHNIQREHNRRQEYRPCQS